MAFQRDICTSAFANICAVFPMRMSDKEVLKKRWADLGCLDQTTRTQRAISIQRQFFRKMSAPSESAPFSIMEIVFCCIHPCIHPSLCMFVWLPVAVHSSLARPGQARPCFTHRHMWLCQVCSFPPWLSLAPFSMPEARRMILSQGALLISVVSPCVHATRNDTGW